MLPIIELDPPAVNFHLMTKANDDISLLPLFAAWQSLPRRGITKEQRESNRLKLTEHSSSHEIVRNVHETATSWRRFYECPDEVLKPTDGRLL